MNKQVDATAMLVNRDEQHTISRQLIVAILMPPL